MWDVCGAAYYFASFTLASNTSDPNIQRIIHTPGDRVLKTLDGTFAQRPDTAYHSAGCQHITGCHIRLQDTAIRMAAVECIESLLIFGWQYRIDIVARPVEGVGDIFDGIDGIGDEIPDSLVGIEFALIEGIEDFLFVCPGLVCISQ